VGVINGDADLYLIADRARAPYLSHVGEDNGGVSSDLVRVGPKGFGVLHPLFHPVLGWSRPEGFDADSGLDPTEKGMHLLVRGAFAEVVVFLQHVLEKFTMEPDAVRWVACVFVALEPVTRYLDDAYLPDAVRQHEDIPGRQDWRFSRAHVRPNQSSHLANRVCGDLDLLLEARTGCFQRSIEALPRRAYEPTVIGTAKAIRVRDAKLQACLPMGAVGCDQAKFSGCRPEEYQVFSQEADFNNIFIQQL
jgi:hypothetical protein